MKAEDDCNPRVRAQLHRNLGLLYSAKGEFVEAAKQFARDIYFSSVGANAHHFTGEGWERVEKPFISFH
jgi:hypothetical protein